MPSLRFSPPFAFLLNAPIFLFLPPCAARSAETSVLLLAFRFCLYQNDQSRTQMVSQGVNREGSNQFHTSCCRLRAHNNSAEPAPFDIVDVSCSQGRLLLDQPDAALADFSGASHPPTKKKMSCKHFGSHRKFLNCSPPLQLESRLGCCGWQRHPQKKKKEVPPNFFVL